MSALYVRALRLFEEFNLGHADGSFLKRLAAIAQIDVLIVDDYAIAPIGPREVTICSNRSTIVPGRVSASLP